MSSRLLMSFVLFLSSLTACFAATPPHHLGLQAPGLLTLQSHTADVKRDFYTASFQEKKGQPTAITVKVVQANMVPKESQEYEHWIKDTFATLIALWADDTQQKAIPTPLPASSTIILGRQKYRVLSFESGMKTTEFLIHTQKKMATLFTITVQAKTPELRKASMAVLHSAIEHRTV